MSFGRHNKQKKEVYSKKYVPPPRLPFLSQELVENKEAVSFYNKFIIQYEGIANILWNEVSKKYQIEGVK